MITLLQIQEKLAAEIQNSGMSQTALAQKIGVKQSQISCYLHGKKLPALDTLANLCVALDIDPADVLCTKREK